MLDWTATLQIAGSYQIDRLIRPRDNREIRISGIGECRRKIAYRVLATQKPIIELPIWSHGLSIFDTGHGVHLRLQWRLSNAGPLKWVDADPIVDADGQFGWAGNMEVPVRSETYRLRGTLDCLTRPLVRERRKIGSEEVEILVPTDDESSGTRYVIDIKTITGRDRPRLLYDPDGNLVDGSIQRSTFERLAGPKPEHIDQASLYAWLTTQPGFSTDRISGPLDKIPEIMIAYVAKDIAPEYYDRYPEDYPPSQRVIHAPIKVFTRRVDLDRVQELLRRVDGIWRALDAGKLPARDYHYTPERPDWHCRDCQYRAECYRDEGYFEDDRQITVPPIVRVLEELSRKKDG